jgi:2-polyprenyl-3-methyl-5-hydroxy-6-metoxy-1,4-benzoquinol methylase/uncharacterized protein YbaR (Trm112 family)
VRDSAHFFILPHLLKMQHAFLNLLRCPVTKTNLRFELISEFQKNYNDEIVTEIKDGLLISEAGFIFPIIDGIPRMLVEAMYDYSSFLKMHLNHYPEYLSSVEKNNGALLKHCRKKNRKTKESFELEWSFLKPEKKDKVWDNDLSEFPSVFCKELGKDIEYAISKTILDAGSGHGLMTSAMASYAELCVGAELSKAVETAYQRNNKKNVFYVQADVQYLPFANHSFDILYSSGVIHHTNNTELSFQLIETLVKPQGRICLWLYHPQKKIFHSLSLAARKITRHLPVKLNLVLVLVFVFPFTWLIKKIKNRNSPNYREEIINVLDSFTPEYRFEIPHDVAMGWLAERNYINVSITTTNQFGFSLSGDKV